MSGRGRPPASVSDGCRRLPHGVLEQLGQDVVQGQRDEGEAGRHVAVDPHPGGVPVLVLTETPEETRQVEPQGLVGKRGRAHPNSKDP